MATSEKNPHIPSVSPDLSHLSRCPSEAISSIEKLSGLPISSLCSANISSTCPRVYEAVVQYAALSRNQLTPLRVDRDEQALWYEQKIDNDFEEFDDNSSYSDSDSDEENNRSAERKVKKMIQEEENKQLEKQKLYHRPNFQLGYGQTTVVWPPPHHLSTQHLRDEELQLRASRSNNTVNNFPPLPESEITDAGTEEPDILYLVSFEAQPKEVQDWSDKIIPVKEIFIFSKPNPLDLGTRNNVISRFLIEVVEWQKDRIPERPAPPRDFLEVYRLRVDECSKKAQWQFEGVKRARTSDTVILKDGQMDSLVNDVKKFLHGDTKLWYKKHGIPLRRQYIFYGPPGTGKTSTIKVLSSMFNKSCCFLGLTGSNFSNQVLQDALSKLPEKGILVVEDVDGFFHKRENQVANNNLSFSTFLNALDGILSVEGVITIMTTNHIDKLDEALLRVGRIDKKFYFGPPDDSQVQKLFQTFYEKASDELAKKFVQKVKARPSEEKAWSMSSLQELFVASREKSAEECMSFVDEYFEQVNILAKEIDKKQKEVDAKNEKAKETTKEKSNDVKKDNANKTNDKEMNGKETNNKEMNEKEKSGEEVNGTVKN